MVLQMVAMDQLVQIIGGFWVIFVDVGNFGSGFTINQIVQPKGDCHTQCDGGDHRQNPNLGFNGFRYQIEAHNAQHHAACKAQQQADGAFGIFLQHGTDQAAQSCTQHTCNGCGYDQCFNNTHGGTLFSLS